MKARITMRALIQRINRKLAKEEQKLKKSRGLQMSYDVGDYFIIDTYQNNTAAINIDPVELGKEIGVLKPYEEVLDVASNQEKSILKIQNKDPILKKGQAVIKSLIRSRERVAMLKDKMLKDKSK